MNTARFFTALLLSLSLGMTAYAQDEDAAESSAPEKVDMQDLEKKHWAPSDQGYTVVQDRTYSKDKKIGLTLFGGPILMYDWYEGFSFGASVSYHFNERWGIEGQFLGFSLSETGAVEEVNKLGGAINRGQVNGYVGVTGRWVPFYSKMSFMGQKIVYFDMSFGASLGMVQYEQQQCVLDGAGAACENFGAGVGFRPGGGDKKTAIAAGFDISQTYFITPKLAFRVDYAMKFFNEEVVPFNPASGTNEDKLSNFTTLNLGLTYLF